MPDETTRPTEDFSELIAWLDDLLDQLPNHAEAFGVTQRTLKELPQLRAELREDWYRAPLERLNAARRQLLERCPKALELPLFRDAFSRLLTIKEPKRTEMFEVLEEWVKGVRSADEVVPGLRWEYWKEGIRLISTPPNGCERMSYYGRRKGSTPWRFFAMVPRNTHLFSTRPEAGSEDDWFLPGDTMQFVTFGAIEWNQPLGLPSEIVEVRVPEDYPVVPEQGASG